jgi:hypothetical protein
VIDDLDHFDSQSVTYILDLFEAVRNSSAKHRIAMVIGYNPMNPTLRAETKAHIATELSEEKLIEEKAESWTSVEVAPLELEQLVNILWDHFGSPVPERLVNVIETEFPGTTRDTGQLLGFFVQLEKSLHSNKAEHDSNRTTAEILESLQDTQVLEKFDKYIRQDANEVKHIIKEIKRLDQTGKSLEFLKFMLAFHGDDVHARHMEKALKKRRCYDLSHYETVLQDKQLSLIRKTSGYYRFRNPHLKRLLSFNWSDWEDRAEEYFTEAFDVLLKEKRWDPEQALKSDPYKEAVEILHNQGLYFYQYHGQSDAGHVLRFWNSDDGGAVSKWRFLFLRSANLGEELWDKVYWNTETKLNPYKGLSSKQPPEEISVPDLLINTATAYWIVGQTQKACDTLAEWNQVRDLITPSYGSQDIRLGRDSAAIDLLHAQILFHRGEGEDWKEASEQLCDSVLENPYAEESQRAQAEFIAASIENHRHYAVGNRLPPLSFKPDNTIVEQILAIAAEDNADHLVRLRAMYSVSSMIWNDHFNKLIDPARALQNGIDQTRKPVRLDRQQLTRLRAMLEDSIALLKEARSRPQRWVKRPQDAPPGGRALEAELLFWEAVLVYQRLLLLAIDVELEAKQYKHRLTQGMPETKARVHESLADSLEEKYGDFIYCGLFRQNHRTSLERSVRESSEQIRKALKPSSSRPSLTEAQRQLKASYDSVYEGAVHQAMDLFDHAATIYRRLGHKQGTAEIAFQRGLMLLLTETGPDQAWRRSLADSNRAINELGFQLDRLHSNIEIAKYGEGHPLLGHVANAIFAYKSLSALCAHLDPVFPKIVAAEVNFRLGTLCFAWEGEIRDATEDEALNAHKRGRPYFSLLAPFRWGRIQLEALTRHRAGSLKGAGRCDPLPRV